MYRSNFRILSPGIGVFLSLVAATLLSGCSSSTAPVITTWEGDLAPEPPAVLGGRVAAVTQFGRTQISIRIEEGEPGVTYGWRVNAGTCEAEGEIQGGVASYPLLSPGETGTASGETTVAEIFRSGDSYAARVYRSTGTGELVEVCGPLHET